MTEGFGISQSDFKRKTNCQVWRVRNIQVFRKFTMHFFRFSCFGEMLWFGSLSHSQLNEQENQEEVLQDFKAELEEAFKYYDDI